MASRGTLQWPWPCTVLLGLSASVASACDIPVFRYALERWSPDPYEIVQFHEGHPTPETPASADLPADAEWANIRWRPVDMSRPLPPDLRELRQVAPQPDAIVVRHVRTGEPIWSGSIASGIPDELVQSPARGAVAQRLLGGDSAVWLLLEVGDPQRDDAVAELLAEELEALEQSLTLPVDDLDLDISFSVLRVSRADPDEQVLVRTLLGSEWDLAGTREPMAFPVFGRGRVLYALIGPGITRANIREACTFLTGPCACEIKDDNPGFDLLMGVDWGSSLGDLVSTAMLPSVASVSSIVAEAHQADGAAAAPDPERGRSVLHNTGLIILIAMLGIFLATVLVYRGKR